MRSVYVIQVRFKGVLGIILFSLVTLLHLRQINQYEKFMKGYMFPDVLQTCTKKLTIFFPIKSDNRANK